MRATGIGSKKAFLEGSMERVVQLQPSAIPLRGNGASRMTLSGRNVHIMDDVDKEAFVAGSSAFAYYHRQPNSA